MPRVLLVAFVSLLFVATSAAADVIELKTGQKVEGAFKGADAAAVRIEVGGQTVTFKPEQVRAIYYGAAPAPAKAELSARDEAMKSLRSLRSVAQGGITYRDYAPRVSDAKIVVDRYLQDAAEPDSPAKISIGDALAFYVYASSAWNAQITENYSRLGSNPLIERCPPLRDKLAKIPAQLEQVRQHLIAKNLSQIGLDLNDARDRQVTREIPAIWSCAADRLAEAEKLLGK